MGFVTFKMNQTLQTFVVINETSVKENWKNDPKIQKATVIGELGDTDSAPKTNITDLKRTLTTFEVDGVITPHIERATTDSLETTPESAQTVRNNLRDMRDAGGKITMNYEGTDFNGIIESCQIIARPEMDDIRTSTNNVDQAVAVYDVKIIFVWVNAGQVRGQV